MAAASESVRRRDARMPGFSGQNWCEAIPKLDVQLAVAYATAEPEWGYGTAVSRSLTATAPMVRKLMFTGTYKSPITCLYVGFGYLFTGDYYQRCAK